MPGPGPAGDPVELWKTPLQGRITTSVALSNGVVFARTENGVLGAFDALTGDQLWSVETGGTEETWPTAANGLVYVGIDDGNLLAYDAASGEKQWSYDAGGRSNVTEPVDGVLYGSSTAGVAFAIDATTSEQHWRTQVTSESLRGPALADGVLYFTSGGSSGAVYALDAASGTVLWTHALPDYDFVPTPSVSDGRVYIVPRNDATMTGAVIALDAATGDEVWRFAAEADAACSVPTIVDGNAFVVCLQGYSYALDAATGSVIWSAYSATADPVERGAGQQYADGVIYQPDDTRTVLAVDAATGAELWRYEVDGFLGEMAVTGGAVYFGTGSGSLYALGGTDNLRTSQATPVGPATPLAASSPVAAAASMPVQFIRQIQNGNMPFDAPFGATIDAEGNFLVVESGQNRIVKLAPDGTQLGIIGDDDGPGRLEAPNSVAVDAEGNTYVGNNGRDSVVKFGPDGEFLLAWGSTGTADGQFDEPAVSDIDAQGRIWVTDGGNHRIQVFDPQGNHAMTIGGFGSGAGQLNHPNTLSLDADGNAYVTECDNRRVSKFAPDGTFLLSWDHDFLCLAGITVDDEHGIIYVSDADQQRIQVFDTDGNFLTMWGAAGTEVGEFLAPIGIVLDGRGHVYVTDIASGKISVFALKPPLWPEGTPVA
jgi:outer membrane protein assembly factor BamB